MSRFRPNAVPTRIALDDATIEKLADRIATKVLARLDPPPAPRAEDVESALAAAAAQNGSVSLSPELMRGLVRMVLDNLSGPDTGAVVENLRGLGVLADDGGLPLQTDTLRKA